MKDKLFFLRIATSLIFIVSGMGHLIRPEKILSQLGKNPIGEFMQALPMIDVLIKLSGIPLLVFGFLLLFNEFISITSIALLFLTLGITASTHIGVDSIGPLLKNVVIMAALYTIFLQDRTAEDRIS